MSDASVAVPGTGTRSTWHGILFTVLALAILFLTIVPVGMAVFWLGFARGDSPCVMCGEQRIGMILISLTGLFVLRFGPRPKYIGMAIIIAGWGLFMGMRHAGMHAARDIGQGFSAEILGAHTYTWAVITYWVCVLVMGVLLLLVRDEHVQSGPRTLRGLERLAGGAFLVVVAANIVQAFASTGPPPFMGQSDPVRFSFNPRHWHWSLEEWNPARIGLRGRWAVDAGFSVDIGRIAGAAFLDSGAVIAVGENKSYVVLRPNDRANADSNFRYFLESRDQFDEVSRSRFGTVRARLFYIMSAAYDPASNSVYTITFPNNRVKRLIVSRFDRRDLMLSEEYAPTLSAESGLALVPKRALDELAVTGAAVADGRLFALSAAYGTLLTIDLATRQVVTAHAIPGLTRPTGIAVKGGELYIVDDAGGLTVVSRPPVLGDSGIR